MFIRTCSPAKISLAASCACNFCGGWPVLACAMAAQTLSPGPGLALLHGTAVCCLTLASLSLVHWVCVHSPHVRPFVFLERAWLACLSSKPHAQLLGTA